MHPRRTALLTLALALGLSVPAGAYEIRDAALPLDGGPKLTAEGIVWVGVDGSDEVLRYASADGQIHELMRGSGACDQLKLVDTSRQAIVVERDAGTNQAQPGSGRSCSTDSSHRYVGSATGGFTPLPDGTCANHVGAALDGDRLLIAPAGCDGGATTWTVRTLDGSASDQSVAIPSGGTIDDGAFAGRWAAAAGGSELSPTAGFIPKCRATIYDLTTGEVALDQDLGTRFSSDPDASCEVAGADVRADGTLVAAIVPEGEGRKLETLSAAAPAPHVASVDASNAPFALAGDLVAMDAPEGGTVYDLDGDKLDLFATHDLDGAGPDRALDFDGQFLAWQDTDDGGGVHREPYSYTEPTATATPTTAPAAPPPASAPPASAPTPAAAVRTPALAAMPSGSPPRARLRKLPSSTRAAALKRIAGTAATHGRGPILAVGVSVVRLLPHRRCQALRSDGRLGLPKAPCLTNLLPAVGTTSWRLALVKRLPPGRYRVDAVAVDAGGGGKPASATLRVR